MSEYKYKVNVKANLDTMTSKGLYVDVKDGATVIFRLAPPVDDSGIIFHLVYQHWKLKDVEGNGIALANLGVHGNDATGTKDYIEELSDVLIKQDIDETIGRAIKANKRYYTQGWEGKADGQGGIKYDKKARLLSLPKTPSEAALKIITNQEQLGEPTLSNPDNGVPLLVSRTGTGFNTRYQVDRGSQHIALSDINPDWESNMIPDVIDVLNLKIYTREMQKQIARISYKNLDWEMLEKEYGL